MNAHPIFFAILKAAILTVTSNYCTTSWPDHMLTDWKFQLLSSIIIYYYLLQTYFNKLPLTAVIYYF